MKLNDGKSHETDASNTWWFSICSVFIYAGYQSCISQLNGLIVLPNSCRLIFTTANSHAKGYIFYWYKWWDWLQRSHSFKWSHLILPTPGRNELWYFFLIRDIKVSFVSFSLQIHANSAVRNFKACLTGETDSLIQVGRFTLMVLSTK